MASRPSSDLQSLLLEPTNTPRAYFFSQLSGLAGVFNGIGQTLDMLSPLEARLK